MATQTEPAREWLTRFYEEISEWAAGPASFDDLYEVYRAATVAVDPSRNMPVLHKEVLKNRQSKDGDAKS